MSWIFELIIGGRSVDFSLVRLSFLVLSCHHHHQQTRLPHYPHFPYHNKYYRVHYHRYRRCRRRRQSSEQLHYDHFSHRHIISILDRHVSNDVIVIGS